MAYFDPSDVTGGWGAGLGHQVVDLPPEIRVVSRRPAPLFYVAAEEAHILPIARAMRAADVAEAGAATGKSPEEALRFAMGRSDYAVTALVDGKPAAMFGVCTVNVLTKAGVPWFLGTEAIVRDRRLFLRQSRKWLERFFQDYGLLRNAVDDRNEEAKRWLTHMGATLSDPQPIGFDGAMFRIFELRAPHV